MAPAEYTVGPATGTLDAADLGSGDGDGLADAAGRAVGVNVAFGLAEDVGVAGAELALALGAGMALPPGAGLGVALGAGVDVARGAELPAALGRDVPAGLGTDVPVTFGTVANVAPFATATESAPPPPEHPERARTKIPRILRARPVIVSISSASTPPFESALRSDPHHHHWIQEMTRHRRRGSRCCFTRR
jgi:hypothetical protein